MAQHVMPSWHSPAHSSDQPGLPHPAQTLPLLPVCPSLQPPDTPHLSVTLPPTKGTRCATSLGWLCLTWITPCGPSGLTPMWTPPSSGAGLARCWMPAAAPSSCTPRCWPCWSDCRAWASPWQPPPGQARPAAPPSCWSSSACTASCTGWRSTPGGRAPTSTGVTCVLVPNGMTQVLLTQGLEAFARSCPPAPVPPTASPQGAE
ncbi:magnesium-dependent phosphatase 1 isoform X2 [Caretta caretta]|uniref:magnesium-dependent phosphatase 1 isoform X2 n=1 Tax=Caretta caretta TaxID=8467 RepID=UPI003F4C9CA8